MKITIFPIENNPYQIMLHEYITKKGIELYEIKKNTKSKTLNLLLFYLNILKIRSKGVRIFHMHWVDFSFPFNNLFIRIISTINTLFSIFWIKILGYKIIWTIHNVLPHEKQTINDKLVLKLIIKISDKIIVHSKSTIDQLNILGININKFTIIPHPNYINYYPNFISRKLARKKFKIGDKKFVFLFLGYIRKYKGLEELIEKFRNKFENKSNALLIIAGIGLNIKYQNKIINLTKNQKNIKTIIKYISDHELQYYYNASNIVILPYKNITTSGSAILSFSFHRTIIAPYIGSLQDIPESFGFFYNTLNTKDISDALDYCFNNRKIVEQRNEKVFNYIKLYSVNYSGDKLIEVYQSFYNFVK